MEIVFSNPEYLWGLAFIPVIVLMHFLSLNYSKARALKFANFPALARISKGVGSNYNITILIIRILIFALIILAISGTVLVYYGKSASAAYVLAIDASSSMLVDDFEPNRMEAAKESAGMFVDNLPIGSFGGVISFSGTPFVNQVLSDDKGDLKKAINEISPQSVGGTDIGSAIVAGTNLLLASDKPRIIVLITDGRSNIGLDEDVAIDYANSNRIVVYAIGIGSKYSESNPLGVDESSLRRISEETLGRYFFAENKEQLKGIYEVIVKTSEGKKFLNLALIFVMIALILLVIDWALISTGYIRIPF